MLEARPGKAGMIRPSLRVGGVRCVVAAGSGCQSGLAREAVERGAVGGVTGDLSAFKVRVT